jgi:hypothetical protein
MGNSQNGNSKADKSPTEKNIISVDPGTLVLIISLLILIPLIVTGFTSQ